MPPAPADVHEEFPPRPAYVLRFRLRRTRNKLSVVRNLMEPDNDLRRPTLAEALWLGVFIAGFVFVLASLAP